MARIQVVNPETGHKTRKNLIFDTREGAKNKLREMLGDLAKGHEPQTKSTRLGDYLDVWLTTVKAHQSPNTHARHSSAVKAHIKPDTIAAMKIADIRVRHLNEFFERRVIAGVKPATILNIRATLSSALQQAVQDARIHENPVRKTKAPRQAEKRIRFLSQPEIAALVKKAKGHDLEPLLVTAIYTGMRLSELLGITWDRLDFKKGTITVDRQLQRHEKRFYLAPLKTRGGRHTIQMAPAVADRLKLLTGAELMRDKDIPQPVPGLVFVTSAGQPHHRKTTLERTNALMKDAGVPQIGFHALRHTCASILISGGADALRVQRQLGHSSVRMTLDTYSHLFEERLQGNIDLIDQALG